MRYLLLTSLLFYFITIQSCEKAPNNGVPSYIAVDSVYLNTTSAQGSSQQGITTLWLESEGEDIGVYEYPNVIPALISGEREIIINAGVNKSGDYFTREIYPAFKPYKANLNFTQKDTVHITPVFEYYDEVEFIINEDFEAGNIFSNLNRTDAIDTNNIDGRCLHIELDETDNTVFSLTSSSYNISYLSRIYLEMQVKYTNDFAIGIQSIENGNVVSEDFIQVFAETADWTYIYQDITKFLTVLNAEAYVFFIQSSKYPNVSKSDIYLDNFKILKF